MECLVGAEWEAQLLKEVPWVVGLLQVILVDNHKASILILDSLPLAEPLALILILVNLLKVAFLVICLRQGPPSLPIQL